MLEVAIRLYIEPLRIGARGPRSRVHLNSPSGPVLVDASIQPLLDGARALLCRGITGDVELWDNERPFPRMRGKIEELSKWRVKENNRVSPTFVPYEPIPDTGCRLRWAKRKHRQASHTHLAEVARRQCFCQGVFTRPRPKADLPFVTKRRYLVPEVYVSGEKSQ